MEKIEYTYLMFDGTYYKIGKTVDVKKRYKSLRTGNPNIRLIAYTDQYDEKELHTLYKEYRYKLEWFKFDDEIILDVINKFENTNNNLILKYFSKRNIKFDDDTQQYTCYNPTSYNLKNYDRFINKNGQYKLGEFCFSSKQNLQKFLRCLLNDLPLDTIIEDKRIIKLVEELITYHPKYDGFLETSSYKYIKTKLDTEESKEVANFNRYSNFTFVFEDSEWNFSNMKCINNMDNLKTTAKRKNKIVINKDFKLTFGKYKGENIKDIIDKDLEYLRWAYENINEFKTKIDSSKYKNIMKINFSVKYI